MFDIKARWDSLAPTLGPRGSLQIVPGTSSVKPVKSSVLTGKITELKKLKRRFSSARLKYWRLNGWGTSLMGLPCQQHWRVHVCPRSFCFGCWTWAQPGVVNLAVVTPQERLYPLYSGQPTHGHSWFGPFDALHRPWKLEVFCVSLLSDLLVRTINGPMNAGLALADWARWLASSTNPFNY